MTTTFTGTVSSANSGNYYTIFNTDTGAAFNNVSLAIGDSLGTSYKSGMGICRVNISIVPSVPPKATTSSPVKCGRG